MMGGKGGLLSAVRTPIGAVLMLVVAVILAGIAAVTAISGQLTAAAVSAAGFVVVVFLLALINLV